MSSRSTSCSAQWSASHPRSFCRTTPTVTFRRSLTASALLRRRLYSQSRLFALIPVRVECVHFSLAEIANEDIATETAKGERCSRDAPWRIQPPTAGEAPQQMTVGVENVDKAIARARHIVVFFLVLLCIGDKEITVDVLDAERGEPNWNVRIREVAADLLRRRRPEAGSAIGGEHIDRRGPEVRRKEKGAVNAGAENQTFVNRARRVIDGEDGLIKRSETASPSGNRPVLGVEDECCRGGRIGTRNVEVGFHTRPVGAAGVGFGGFFG